MCNNGIAGREHKPGRSGGFLLTVAHILLGVTIGWFLASSGKLSIGYGSTSSATSNVGTQLKTSWNSVNRSAPDTTDHTPTQSKSIPILEEYIPASLRDQYESHLVFNVTRNMLRQSRPVIGNNQRLHAYLRKLHQKQCTTVLILGGSVTAGHNVKGGAANAYPRLFMDWLNTRYPCVQTNGATGSHQFKKTNAVNSQTHFTSWSMVDGIERFDLVLLEFNINDHFISELPHALEDKAEAGQTKEYKSLWYYETILRRLLLMRKPDPPAVVTFNADYVGRTWALPPLNNPESSRKTLFRSNQEPMKIWLCGTGVSVEMFISIGSC